MKTLADVGEFGWIARLKRKEKRAPGVVTGIGDDTAVLRVPAGKDLLFTTDMLLEGRHFRRSEATARQIGRKALAVNLSDIAAMGGTPTHAVVAIGLPARTPLRYAEEISAGLRVLAKKYGVSVVGGDTNRSDRTVISVALLGEAPAGKKVLRSGARPGDVVFVTGTLGGSYASRKHLTFEPRLAESRWLLKHCRPTSMMDLSDGLASDARRLAQASGVDLVIEARKVPVSPGAGGLDRALFDGEDFELLFTVPRASARRLAASAPKGLARFRPVGSVRRGRGRVWLYRRGKIAPLPEKGFDHFR
jgi:thiamine-monophosphate kinase